MKRFPQIGGIAVVLLSVAAAGCGGSASPPAGGSGSISGRVMRELILTNAPEMENNIRLPETDYEVEVYQGNVLREKSRTDAEGRFTVSVPAGRYRVKPSDAILERTPALISSEEVTVSAGKTATVELEINIATL